MSEWFSSNDGGFSWTYRSNVVGPDAAPGAPKGPNENVDRVFSLSVAISI